MLCSLFKAVNRGKGLLPDPTVMQILTGLNNPAALKMLLNPMAQGTKQGENSEKSFGGWGLNLLLWILLFYSCPGLLGAAPAIPLLANPALSAALLQILLQNQAKVQQVQQSYWIFSSQHVLMSIVFLPFCLILSNFLSPGVFC